MRELSIIVMLAKLKKENNWLMKNGPIQLESNWSLKVETFICLSTVSGVTKERRWDMKETIWAYQPYGILWVDEGQTTLLTPCYSKTILGSKQLVSRIHFCSAEDLLE